MNRRIVIASFGSSGDIYPYIGLALELKARGHTPVIATSLFHQQAIEQVGVEFCAVRPDIAANDPVLLARVMDAKHGTEFLIREIIVPALRASFSDFRAAAAGADLLITHPLAYAAVLVAQQTGVAWTSTVLHPLSLYSRYDLCVQPRLAGIKRLERVPGVPAMFMAISRAATRPWCTPIHEFQRELDLPSRGHPLFEGQHSSAQVLALFSPVLARPQPDWPAVTCVTGAIGYNGIQPAALPRELQTFLDDGDSPVVFTLGTGAVGAAGRFYSESVDAVRQLGLRAVLLVGDYPQNVPRAVLARDVHVEAFVPHAALFPHASVVVHQGGVGTVHQALRSGHPTLIVPFAHDQPDNAYRLKRLGVSLTIDARRYRANRVARALSRLLGETKYQDRAADVGRMVRAEDGVRAACDAIEQRFAPGG